MGLGHIAGLGEALAEQPIFFLREEDTQRGLGSRSQTTFRVSGIASGRSSEAPRGSFLRKFLPPSQPFRSAR